MSIARRGYFPGWHSLTGMLVRTCPTCILHQRSHQRPQQAGLKPMHEFRPMAVIHADLVGPLPEGKNSRNQRGFQYILSVVDAATRYLWLLPIRHKTAECVAATLFDEVISRVSVLSSVLTDRGGEFIGEVVECLLKRLGISHLKMSAYHPQTDAKCERTHFSVHNIISKLIDYKHEKWPDLLGVVALVYNATVHVSTGYSPHELFYSFAPSCPLDAMVSTPASEPASNADEFALQTFERLQEATAFVWQFTGKGMQRMKQRYDVSVRPQSYDVGEKVLLYNPQKQKGQFAKWQTVWSGPYAVVKKLNDCNYSVKKGRGRPAVVHVDRMRKLPTSPDAESGERPLKDECPKTAESQSTNQIDENVSEGTNTHCVDSSSHADSVDRHAPIIHGNPDRDNVCTGGNLGNHRPKMSLSQGTDTATVTAAESAATSSEPRLASTARPARAPPARALLGTSTGLAG